MRTGIILLGFIAGMFSCRGQENNIWHFGVRAGINYKPTGIGGAPFAVMQNTMIASEGCSSVCDDDGNLLFYTNGIRIYNNAGNVMQNGDNLAGNQSSFQAALVVPLPGSTKLFYVFTSDAQENNFANGYRYSIVDMSLDNGKGAVTVKNVLLHAPCTERLAAARHNNGIDVWIIGNDSSSNIFRTWLLTCSGLQTTPVISVAGIKLDQYQFMNVGSIKVSPDGRFLCQTHFPNLGDSTRENFFQLFDFNNSSGVISNPKKIEVPLSKYYAAEFSPNSKLLYLTKADTTGIDQFECSLNSASQIIASQTFLLTNQNFCGIQIGPDEKIYLGFYTSKLSVISKPNIKGFGCLFEADKVDLGGRFGSLTLPSFVNDISVNPYNNFSIRILDTCTGLVQFNGFTNIKGSISWLWDFGDGTTSTLQNPQHRFADIFKFYTVKLRISSDLICGEIIKSKTFPPCGLLTQADFIATGFCDSGYVKFENKSIFYPELSGQYIWDFGDGNFSTNTNPKYTYQTPGHYSVKLKIKTNAFCVDDSLSKSIDVEKLDIQALPDQTINENQSIQLKVTGGGTTFLWEPPEWLNNPNIANPIATPQDNIMYRVTVTNDAGCIDMDTVFITVNLNSNIFVPTAFTPNGDGKNDIFKPILSRQYTLNNFTVFNRWGQKVFTTSKIGIGWDGKVNDQLQNGGVYVWMLLLHDRYNMAIEKKGTFVLIR